MKPASRAVKVWCPAIEMLPHGITNLETAPPNWFREEPAYAAELYALELRINDKSLTGINHYKTVEYPIRVIDENNVRHRFTVKTGYELVTNVKSEDA